MIAIKLRTGLNPKETVLTPTNVNQSTFGKLASFDVDGQMYGNPLYLPDLTIGERVLVLPAIALMFVLGIYPQFILGTVNSTVMQMIQRLRL